MRGKAIKCCVPESSVLQFPKYFTKSDSILGEDNETFSFVFIQVAVKHPDIVACGAQDGGRYLVNGAG